MNLIPRNPRTNRCGGQSSSGGGKDSLSRRMTDEEFRTTHTHTHKADSRIFRGASGGGGITISPFPKTEKFPWAGGRDRRHGLVKNNSKKTLKCNWHAWIGDFFALLFGIKPFESNIPHTCEFSAASRREVRQKNPSQSFGFCPQSASNWEQQ